MTNPPERPPNENYVRSMLDNAARGDPRKPDRVKQRRTWALVVAAVFLAILIAAVVIVVIFTHRRDSPHPRGADARVVATHPGVAPN
jgi:hypothetical protein